MDTSRSYGRDIVRGIRRYVAEHGPWSLYLGPRDLRSGFPDWLKNWRGHGVLSRTVDETLLRHLKATRLPVVELRTTVLKHRYPYVCMDNSLVGARVAEHFRERGFRHFGCVLDTSEAFFIERSECFSQSVRDFGHECPVFESKRANLPQQHPQPAPLLPPIPNPSRAFALNG